MKMKNALFLLLSILVAGCGKDSDPATEVSKTDFENLSYEETVLEIEIKTDLKWTVTSLVDWCKVSQAKGSGSATLKLKLEANIGEARSGVVTVWTEQETIELKIQQTAIPVGQEFHYKTPVVFHVLYKNKGDNKQYVTKERFAKILQNVNSLYKGQEQHKGGDVGVDMNLEFVLAEADEEGNELATPGVNYVEFTSIPMDCESFMSDERYVSMLWDPNQYINVMVYNFAAVDNGTILGISHLPLSVTGSNPLEGLQQTTYSHLEKENLRYPKCISINSLFIYEDMGVNGAYNSGDVNVTLAHELGHYLGLFHAFDEDGNTNSGLSTQCVNSDYCDDTPSYNRIAYTFYLRALLEEAAQAGNPASLSEAVKRENCKTNEVFSSYNLMDYEVSYSDRFTNDQRERIRNVLTYSPLTPGPKRGAAATRSIIHGKLDLPMVIMK